MSQIFEFIAIVTLFGGRICELTPTVLFTDQIKIEFGAQMLPILCKTAIQHFWGRI